MCGLFLFVKCTIALKNGYKTLWRKAREEHLQCKISVIRQDLSSWITWPMLHSRGFRFVSVNKLSAGKWLRGMTIIMIKARLPFARKDLYHLHISSDTIILFDLFPYQGCFGQPQILCWPNYLVFAHLLSPHGPCHCQSSLSALDPWSPATWAPKSLQIVTADMQLKGTCSLKESYDKPRQHIKKQRHHFANKGPSSQSCVFFPKMDLCWQRSSAFKYAV